jgi:hypothetical protein
MKLRLLLFAVLLSLAAVLASAQATHSITLTWTASTDAAANPSLTYNVYVFVGVCPASPPPTVTAALALGFVKNNPSPVTGLTYVDNGAPPPLLAGNVHCDFVTAVLGSAESVPSNLVQAIIPVGPASSVGAVVR